MRFVWPVGISPSNRLSPYCILKGTDQGAMVSAGPEARWYVRDSRDKTDGRSTHQAPS